MHINQIEQYLLGVGMNIIGSINTKFISNNEQSRYKIFKKIDKIILGGANIIRINLSHGNHKDVECCIDYIKSNHRGIRILLDLQGNKIRVAKNLKESFKVESGEIVYFCAEDSYEIYLENMKESKLVPLDLKNKFIYKNNFKRIYMKDATMEFLVLNNKDGLIKSKVKVGGIVRAEKGCNLPNLDRKNWGLSNNDLEDIKFALRKEVDIIDYSYCSYLEECLEFKRVVFKNLRDRQLIPKLWGKIETREGVKNIKEIAKELDGIVIARGDLTAEVGILNVPVVQEKILYALREIKTNITVATNLLPSIRNKGCKPNISELSDIYDFVKLGVTGFMLTGETSTGENEEHVVKTLKKSLLYYEDIFSKLKQRN